MASSVDQMCTDQMCTYNYKTNGFISRSNVQMLLQERHFHQHIKCAQIKCTRITTRHMASSVDQLCTCYYKRDIFINRSNVHRSNVHISLQDKWFHPKIKCARITARKMASSTDQMCTTIRQNGFISRSNVHM